MKLEDWVSIASLGLSIMFVLLIISAYTFLINLEKGLVPDRIVDINGILIQFISIAGAPGIILAGVVYALSKTSGAKLPGYFLLAAGVSLIIGLGISLNIMNSSSLISQYPMLYLVPMIFIIAGIGICIISILLLRKFNRIRYSGMLK